MAEKVNNFLLNQLNAVKWNSKFRTGTNTFNPGVEVEIKARTEALNQAGDHQQAFDLLYEQSNLHYDHVALNQFQLALKGLGQFEQAAEIGMEAYHLGKFYQYKSLVNTASDLSEIGRYVDALNMVKEASALFPERLEAWIERIAIMSVRTDIDSKTRYYLLNQFLQNINKENPDVLKDPLTLGYVKTDESFITIRASDLYDLYFKKWD